MWSQSSNPFLENHQVNWPTRSQPQVVTRLLPCTSYTLANLRTLPKCIENAGEVWRIVVIIQVYKSPIQKSWWKLPDVTVFLGLSSSLIIHWFLSAKQTQGGSCSWFKFWCSFISNHVKSNDICDQELSLAINFIMSEKSVRNLDSRNYGVLSQYAGS